MKFYPPNIVRFFYRYALIFVLILLPLFLGVDAILSYRREGLFDLSICTLLAIFGGMLIHVSFWEKFFGIIILSNTEIRWKCPFRRTRVILLHNCTEIGAYLENENSGFPSEQIYFSDHAYPKQHMTKNGIMKSSQHLIKFWYSEELCTFIIHNYSSKLTSCLSGYRRQRKNN